MKLRYCAGESDDGRKLIGILRRELGLSASLVKRLKMHDGISVNGEPSYTDRRIFAGDVVEADILITEQDTVVQAEYGELEVLFEDEAFLAVNKPCGMLTHPSRKKNMGTLQNYVLGYLSAKGERAVCHAVNRLDRDTSGVVLFSKSAHFKTLAAEALRGDEAEKTYLALVYGELSPICGELSWRIKRAGTDTMRRCVSEDGQPALTEYETLWSGKLCGETVSFLRLRLKTGRTHQIRVHCAYAGAPLLGDALYGTEASRALSERMGISAQALHAEKLRFCPIPGKDAAEICAPMKREDMKKILKMLEIIY